jgi:hypothetical protein
MLLWDAIAEKLNTKLSKWKPEISQEARALSRKYPPESRWVVGH